MIWVEQLHTVPKLGWGGGDVRGVHLCIRYTSPLPDAFSPAPCRNAGTAAACKQVCDCRIHIGLLAMYSLRHGLG